MRYTEAGYRDLSGEQPRIGLLVVGFGSFNEAVKLSAGSYAAGCITEQPVLALMPSLA